MYDITILLYYYTTLSLYYYITVPPYYCSSILLYCHIYTYYIIVLLYYYSTILLEYCTTILQCQFITVFLHHNTAILLLYYITILLCYYTPVTVNFIKQNSSFFEVTPLSHTSISSTSVESEKSLQPLKKPLSFHPRELNLAHSSSCPFTVNFIVIPSLRLDLPNCILLFRFPDHYPSAFPGSPFDATWNIWAPTGRVFMKFDISVFLKNAIKIKVSLKSDKNDRH